MNTAVAPVQSAISAASGQGTLPAAAERAARVMAHRSPQTQRTYLGVYRRFGEWLANAEGVGEVDVRAFTVDALLSYLDQLEQRAAPSTVKKERAALRKLARYLHQLGAIDATEILMVEIPTVHDTAPTRQGLDSAAWERVLAVARARVLGSSRGRASAAAAARDLALVQVLGGAGLRSGETRALPVDPFDRGRSDNRGGAVYLRVSGKGRKLRAVPLYSDVADALECWRSAREQIGELADDPLLFPQLGRHRRDGSFPDAGGQLSTTAVIKIVRPIMLAAGIPVEQAHPHTLRHTFGRTYMSAPGAELSRLQRIMGHSSPETTSQYVHHADHELGAEHLRIERTRHDPLARRQQHRRDRAAQHAD